MTHNLLLQRRRREVGVEGEPMLACRLPVCLPVAQ